MLDDTYAEVTRTWNADGVEGSIIASKLLHIAGWEEFDLFGSGRQHKPRVAWLGTASPSE